LIDIRSAAGGTGAAAAAGGNEAGRQLESGPVRGLDEVHGDGLNLVIQGLIDHKLETVVLERLVVLFRLIQSHAQGGPRSASLENHHPDRLVRIPVLHEILDHLICFFRYREHVSPVLSDTLVSLELTPSPISRLESRCNKNRPGVPFS